jgi:hypothetical protein
MKSIFFAVAVAALVGAAIASCPNACSGRGSCGNHDRCTCYANFVGGDCSGKACPYGRSGKECSGRGTCDRGAGSCECADGYAGASCQRTSCPNGCSGKGSCDTTTGMCSCTGGYSGNDCGTRLCPKGDDPLTYEVENSGDGKASQQSEVQTVTFNAGRGIGGTATLTYNDLYGQSWTTRPFNVGGDHVYRLEVSIVPGTTCGSNKCDVVLSYNGATATIAAHADSAYAISSKTIDAPAIRAALLATVGGHVAKRTVFGKDRGSTIYVREHYSTTSVKIGGSISPATRVTFDIHLPIDMATHDDNGGLNTAFTAAWGATPTANTAELKLYQLGDRSAEIESALTSLPNQVIPSVTVSKVGVTDSDTNSDGANGNVYSQSYSVTFNNAANSGDQNMLTCNAGPCDEDGCTNRGPGVSEVRYMHHDPENHGEGINFVNQGYFIMDIGEDAPTGGGATAIALSAGSIKIIWDTGAGIESAIFAIVATAAEVQAALRTITGWEAVTVELWGSIKDADGTASKLLAYHQFKVTFAAGYDDLGKSPTFYTMLNTDGAYATASPTGARARLYDQRFSNSIWLGKTTGFVECVSADATACTLKHTDIAGTATTISAMAQNGDQWVTSDIYFGAGAGTGGDATAPGSKGSDLNDITLHHSAQLTTTIEIHGTDGTDGDMDLAAGTNFAYLKEGATSVQTSDYFAVGSTVEVLPVTWDDGAAAATAPTGSNLASVGTDVSGSGYNSNNVYRSFKVTGHVTNEFNREFAKLDSFPANDGVTPATTNANKPDYNLKITSNNGTVHSYPSVAAKITLNEVQVVVMGNGETGQSGQVFKLYYKGEESQDMTDASTPAQVAEEINGFSALSGPVSVAEEGVNFVVTFDAKDGDVAQMTAAATAGAVTIVTRAHGWSIEAPLSLSDLTLNGLDTMQAGGIINVTAQEVCTFTLDATDGTYIFCYDGICSSTTVTGAADADVKTAVHGIKDNNGDQLLTVTNTGYAITMPMGKSCDGLELRHDATGATTSIAKTVNKHNNGKLFRITRSFSTATVTAGALASATTLTCASSSGDAGCHGAVADVDSLVISQGSSGDCGAALADTVANADGVYPIHRKITGVAIAAGVVATMTVGATTTGGSITHTSNCVYTVGRHVVTLDSAPTASAVGTAKTLLYTSPVGSCSVAETTKGTYESYECSNRGACDGKSGLCTCYEGYSGQSCQTQTVLV